MTYLFVPLSQATVSSIHLDTCHNVFDFTAITKMYLRYTTLICRKKMGESAVYLYNIKNKFLYKKLFRIKIFAKTVTLKSLSTFWRHKSI